MDKSIKDKAIDIKGKAYVMVKDRVTYLNEEYLNPGVKTEATFYENAGMWVVKATIYPDGKDGRSFDGHSQAVIGSNYINKEAALENAETSAVGRALAFMGIGVIDSIASIDEINKATAPKEAAVPTVDIMDVLVTKSGLDEQAIKDILKPMGIDSKAKIKKTGITEVLNILKEAVNELQ